MADKTPDPAEGARNRKRPAPTIDLTATEVGTDTQDAGADKTQDERSAAAGKSGFWRWTRPAAQAGWQTLAAGCAGAAVMAVVLIALWSTGLVPARSDGPRGADPSSIDAVNERIGKLESAAARIPKDSSVSEHLAAADNAMRSLGITLTALNKRIDDVTADIADARARAAASEKAVAEVRNNLQDLSRNTSAGLSPGDIAAVQRRLATLEQTAKSTTDNAARLALSAAALRDAVASGAPFSAELEQVRSLDAGAKILATLSPFAASGMPTPAALAQELRALIPAMLKASGARAPAGGFLERLQANAGRLVRIRPVDAPAGDDPSTVLARIEIETARADIDAALGDLARLDGQIRAPAQNWIVKAQARKAALDAVHQFAADTARALAKQ